MLGQGFITFQSLFTPVSYPECKRKPNLEAKSSCSEGRIPKLRGIMVVISIHIYCRKVRTFERG